MRSQAFAYDLADRLTSATGGYGAIGYSYDANGNRLSRTDAAGTAVSVYEPASNRIGSSGATVFTRDVAGNRLTDGQFAYTYAVNNRLIAVAHTNSGDTNLIILGIYPERSQGQSVRARIKFMSPELHVPRTPRTFLVFCKLRG